MNAKHKMVLDTSQRQDVARQCPFWLVLVPLTDYSVPRSDPSVFLVSGKSDPNIFLNKLNEDKCNLDGDITG
jgi:hypothetical protein